MTKNLGTWLVGNAGLISVIGVVAQPGCSSGPESFASWPLSSRDVMHFEPL